VALPPRWHGCNPLPTMPAAGCGRCPVTRRPAVEALGDAVALRAVKVVYVVTLAELLSLLRTNPDLQRRAILRGKLFKRGEATRRREVRVALQRP